MGTVLAILLQVFRCLLPSPLSDLSDFFLSPPLGDDHMAGYHLQALITNKSVLQVS